MVYYNDRLSRQEYSCRGVHGLVHRMFGRITANPTLIAPATRRFRAAYEIEGDLEGVTIEIDFDDDSAADQTAVTGRLGEFTLSPVGLAYGQTTVHVRAREFDENTKETQAGAWTEFSFTPSHCATRSWQDNSHNNWKSPLFYSCARSSRNSCLVKGEIPCGKHSRKGKLSRAGPIAAWLKVWLARHTSHQLE